MRKSLIALATASIAFAATPAFAGSVSIQYRDLNLNSAEGQQKLERRIDAAARKVCQVDDHTMGSRIRDQKAVTCYRQAKKQAAEQMAVVVEDQRLCG